MKKCIILLFSVLLLIPIHTSAQTPSKPKVLVLYSTQDDKITNNIQILNTQLGHFTNDITTKSLKRVNEITNSSSYTHIVYIGEQKEEFPIETKQLLENFSGPVLVLGQNVEQLSNRFSFITLKADDIRVNKIEYPSNKLKNTLEEERLVQSFDTNGTVLANALSSNSKSPLIIRHETSYYVATSNLFNWMSHYVGEMLFSYFGQKPTTNKVETYLRLEDVHPAADTNQLKEIAELLKEKKIPYMITVIPVYTDPNTGKTLHLKDKPELVDLLRSMQDDGAAIIMHGYTHQFYDSETGEGFEFWDVKTDQPIRQPKHEKPKTKDDFPNIEAYNAYVKKGEEFEEKYTTEHIEKGIQELVDAKLYPVAFEAPHYTMSQKGYEILSKYFSTYVGQLQLSDTTWKSMHSPAYRSTPSFLHGMKLMPETVGFIEEDKPQAIAKMKANAVSVAKLSDGVIGAFYHPYLGVKPLKEVLKDLESIPNIEWIDLQKEANEVKMQDIHITTNKDGIHVEKPTSVSDVMDYVKQYGFFLILGFFIIVFLLLLRRAKKLES
ncbi:polysaccharide deacetylase family protein [Bacillus wiedmannii]|uniref:polysaccharide deacetylase family protein n=1 Tax=Bacillus wiedmannii TaxID=1890302 RepID=UPI0021D1A711|nr:polysaccharide deacetylase family protein [Bacillus wiedmannii]MCU5114757.1 polysaccharide deacetylase family protein [Bacillus wiedmannii]MCU5154565.1 polysaccharide deacetylase family protein [Bacillus wiedmannii]MCU5414395.1 polysaccharide deacetylase family protein [Bacillus wiedmannii]